MNYTPNLSLKKPDSSDYINIDDLNANSDAIDTKIKELNDLIAQVQQLFSNGAALNCLNLNGQLPAYYLNYNNLSNKPTIPTLTSLGGQKSISSGTAAPSGGSSGDIYIQY